MKKILLAAAAISLICAGTASAADMAVKARPAPIVAPVFNWTGFYVGGFVGGASADRDAYSFGPCNAVTCYNAATPAVNLANVYGLGNSFIGGATAGYNWQAPGSAFVFGLEGEVGYLRLAGSRQDINFPPPLANNGTDSTRIGDWYGVIAGRLGWAADRALLYVKGGVAFVDKHTDFTDTCVAGGCGPATITQGRNATQVTWAAGGGLEYAFTNNWSVKGEYLYLATRESFSTLGTSAIIAGACLNCTLLHTDPGVHTGKIGLNYRFGGPVVARY